MADAAVAILQWAFGMVLGEVAKRMQPEYPWIEELVQNARLEREVSESLKAIQGIQSTVEDNERENRNVFIDRWGDQASKSENRDVKEHVLAVKTVAGSVYHLQKAGVEYVTLFTAGKEPIEIGKKVFEEDPEDFLRGMVNIAMAETVVEEVNARGPAHVREKDSPDEVISTEDAARRLVYVVSLVDILQRKWVGDLLVPQDDSLARRRRNLERLESNIRSSWWVKKDADEMDEKLKTYSGVSMEKLEQTLRPSVSRNDLAQRNIFVVGPQRVGNNKSVSRWLLTERVGTNVASSFERTGTELRGTGDTESFRLIVWDTAGFAMESIRGKIYKNRLKENMMKVNGISAVIFQVDRPRALHPSEVEMIEAFDYWFDNKLKDNLMIAFENSEDPMITRTQIQNCENQMSNHIGAVGEENYMCFQLNSDEEETVLAQNQGEIERVANVISKKKVAVIKEKAAVLDVIQNSQIAHDNEKHERLRNVLDSYCREETESLRTWLEGGRTLHARFEDQQLLIFRSKFWPTCFLRSKNYIILRGTCSETIEFLKNLAELKTVHGIGAREWINKICEQSFKFLLLTRDPEVQPRPKYYMYASYAALNQAGIKRVKAMLGREKTLQLLQSIEHEQE